MLGQLSTEKYEDPREVLKTFLNDVVQFLNLVAMREEPNWRPKFREHLLEPMHAALMPLRSHAERVEGKIEKLSAEQIRDHGLEGPELTFKFSVIDDAYSNRGGGGGWNFWGWKRLIESLDVLLESILSATGAGTGISEMKDYIGLSVDGP